MTTTISQAATARTPAPPRRMSVAEYEELIESGVIDEDAPVELIEGRIVGKVTKGPFLNTTAQVMQEILTAALGSNSGWLIWVEKTIALPGQKSLPEPDVALVKGGRWDFVSSRPQPDHVGLVVEVADSSLAKDRRRKEMYLAAGVPAYWILNLADGCLEVYRPGARRKTLRAGDSVELVLDGKAVARISVADMLPPDDPNRRPKGKRS
ncbi:Uma2 family endonuclease [Aquisphaera insulae]|uniref:Uma2 family endonuclease n=1 Tax=Aquisphaera insulae TaxID=2712864 RepID=UPI0013ED6CB5|nr:Uma2 family endonuclease [Aquisphaera insulae]